ncbi:TRAP transporter small permease [Desulfonema ishimotonii]|uniref:TRAP transporter small permease n=1 Tax=Desulfonema ishimotonii TaxID=45657 RepID=A0A401G3G2_9BACT|nr:TRAP transporter small permease [Desulfonema ishimotonii]GBC63782.1 TRAP transporter small permease [Desulfonema ishimotonii]
MDALDRLSHTLNQGVEYLLFALGLSMAVIVAVQVFSRYALNHSLFWSEELARYILVWLTFLGTSVAYRRRVHPGVDMIYTRMPRPLRKISSVLVHLAALSLFGVMIVYGCKFAWFVRIQISPALSLPKWILFSIIPVSGAILTIHGLAFLFNEFSAGGEE